MCWLAKCPGIGPWEARGEGVRKEQCRVNQQACISSGEWVTFKQDKGLKKAKEQQKANSKLENFSSQAETLLKGNGSLRTFVSLKLQDCWWEWHWAGQPINLSPWGPCSVLKELSRGKWQRKVVATWVQWGVLVHCSQTLLLWGPGKKRKPNTQPSREA